jgi:hypothetical protein
MSNGEAEGSHICSDIAVSQCTGYHTAGLGQESRSAAYVLALNVFQWIVTDTRSKGRHDCSTDHPFERH